MGTKQLIFWVWPPYEAKVANDCIREQRKEIVHVELRKQITSQIHEDLSQSDNPRELLSIAKEIREAESKRKEVIENKASTFVYAIGLSVTIISILAALLGSWGEITTYRAFIGVIVYLVSMFFLLTSAYYAIKVRRIKAFHSLCADKFFSVLESKKDKIEEYMVELITDCKMNELPLLIMTNYLSVAEALFLRGLALLAIGSIMIILITLGNLI